MQHIILGIAKCFIYFHSHQSVSVFHIGGSLAVELFLKYLKQGDHIEAPDEVQSQSNVNADFYTEDIEDIEDRIQRSWKS